MGQLWDRARRIAESYLQDDDRYGGDWSKYNLEELRERIAHHGRLDPDEERLRREFEELDRQQKHQTFSSSQNSQGTQNSQDEQQSQQTHRNSSSHQDSQQSRTPSGHDSVRINVALSVLGLVPNASVDDIKHAYKKLMLQHHPDLVAGLSTDMQFTAAEKAQRINEAYQILKDVNGF